MKRVISYFLTGVLITCGISIGTTSNIFANQIAKELYQDIISGKCDKSDDKFKINPGMKLVYDENTGELNNIYYVDKNEPSGYSIHEPDIRFCHYGR
jgi:hypothetical protein